METFVTINKTKKHLSKLREQGKTIGFVPTMGALHEGHLELMRTAKKENDILVVSIFVNPIQFNNTDDLDKYPRDLARDIKLLNGVGCDVLFVPDVEEMYPEGQPIENFDFGNLEKVMEGAFRPGHFNGVAVVVKRLFQIIKPHKAYFGEKDFQQLAIIKQLVKLENINTEIIPCRIVREPDGLAMSSRNMRLSEDDRKLAATINLILREAVKRKNYKSPKELKEWVEKKFAEFEQFDLEYFEIADEKDLRPIENWDENKHIRGFVAVNIGGVRLIDNISLS
jgi:pantoate--beta-alanine ligase